MQRARFNFLSVFTLALLAVALAPQHVVAQDVDPPGRVARLAFAQGPVSFQPAGTEDWVSAVVNRPMTTGDKLWSDNNSRAELHIGSASIRLSSNTGISLLNLTDQVTQLQFTAGTLRIRVRRLAENESFEVDTPNLAFSILRPGIYKLNVNDRDGDATMVTVRSGDGEVTGGGAAYPVHSGEIGTFVGTDQITVDLQQYNNPDDDFDQWCAQRDRREDLSASARYVSPDVIGYEDLDQYGAWRPVGPYGMVWFPQAVAAGWAPYQFGHWAYVYPWGYTWVDDAPWGFAPFHYGRWIFVGGAWGWVPAPPPAPGVVYVRPVYAPALVAWVGGPHFAVGMGAGGFAAGVSVGWFPLGPREVFVPSYPVSRTYVTNVNISNTVVTTTVVNNYYNTVVVNKTVVVNETFVNQRVPGAVVVTSPQAFTSAQPVYRNIVRVDQREIVGAPVNVATPAIAPPRQAVLGAGAAAGVRPPAFVQNRAVVAKLPPPPPPVPFDRQQQAIQANGGRPLAISQVRQLQPQAGGAVHPNVKIAPQVNSQNNHSNFPNSGQAGGRMAQGSNSGQPGAAGNEGNQNNEGYRKFSDRPPSAQPNSGSNPGQGSNNSRQVQGSNGQTAGGGNGGGQGNQGNRTFSDRPSQPNGGNNPGQGQSNGGQVQGSNNNQSGTSGNGGTEGNQSYRKFDRPPASRPGSGESSTSGTGNAESGHQPQPQNGEQVHNGSEKNGEAGGQQENGKNGNSKPAKDDNKGHDKDKKDDHDR